MKKYISIDIGGTAIKYGIIDEKGNVLTRAEAETEAYKGGQHILRKTVEIAEGFFDAENISGICISTAGMVDPAEGKIVYSAPLIPGYTGTKYKETMEKRFGVPCEVENDVNCAGLAESKTGASKDSKVSVMLTIGTGIGGCIIIDGHVFHGFSNSACEVGYMHMSGSDFQTLGAASALSKKVGDIKREPVSEWNGYRIFEEAKKGNIICVKAIDEMADVLGQGIANICYVINPQTVVLGGGIMAQEEYLGDRIKRAVGRYLIPSVADNTKIAFAKHRNDAGMIGAFYNYMNKHGEDD